MEHLDNLQSSPPEVRTSFGRPTGWRRLFGHLATMPRAIQLVFVAVLAIFIAATVSQFAATWLGIPRPAMVYRRIGPENGPQVFCAGSSVVQFGLSWPEVSTALGQGIENWGLGGSTPTEWEVSQSYAANTNLMIIGVSLHDLNENFLCDSHANVVPIAQTIRDLWQSKVDWQFSRRVLSQYPLAYLRILFPTAGKSDAVLVGLRRKIHEMTRSTPTLEEKANFLVLPSGPVLNFGEATEKLSDWPADKALRRIDLLRSEIHDSHRFDGPKHLAFLRMLDRAQQRGGVIVVVMPVAPTYMEKFVTADVKWNFEKSLAEGRSVAPRALFVRLDQLPSLSSDQYYADFVHPNGIGRRIATTAFLNQLGGYSRGQ
jgi:hypothetical protein